VGSVVVAIALSMWAVSTWSNPAVASLRGDESVAVVPVAPKGKVRSAEYWEDRYKAGGTSGAGSYGHRAMVKAQVVNTLLQVLRINSVVELGCGDGAQLKRMHYRKYVGVDVSRTIVERVRQEFRKDVTKSFVLNDGSPSALAKVNALRADMSVSLEVIFHLTEEAVLGQYLASLFTIARRFVLIMSSDREDGENKDSHVRHWPVTAIVNATQPQWTLLETVDFPTDHSFSKFLLYCKQRVACPPPGSSLRLHDHLLLRSGFKQQRQRQRQKSHKAALRGL